MKVIVFVKATKESEAGQMPDEKLLTEMGRFNEELVKAGVMLAGEGLHPSSKGVRVVFNGGNRLVVDGPFAETKELVAGFWIWQGSRWPKPSNGCGAVPIPCPESPPSKFGRVCAGGLR